MLDILGIKKNDNLVDMKAINNIRALGIDMINEAKSGHPGIVLGAAPILYNLYTYYLKFNPCDPKWINRDRFILSAGHGSALLYSTLFMSGYDISLDDLKDFRKFQSITPGHPEYGRTPGVECSTGPLGQGIANAVGMAMAEKYLETVYNVDNKKIIDYKVYCMCGDGDLMEGISYEAVSLAGTLKLNNLILLYDCNKVSLDGNTANVFDEDIEKRFSSCSWNVLSANENDDQSISKAFENAILSKDKPTIIIFNTTLGKYSINESTNKIHGSITPDDITNIKEKLGIMDIPFTVLDEPITYMKETINNRNSESYNSWNELFNSLSEEIKEELIDLRELKNNVSLKNISFNLPEDKKESTRVSSGKILNALADENKLFLGGSADLASSTKTYLNSFKEFNSNDYSGKNIMFGVREHAMGGIINGMTLSGLTTFGSTFLAFSDYLKPSIRMSALMDIPSIFIFTHDSVSVGEDGPTHQPIEQLISLRSIPNLEVFRPADSNEVIGTYKTIIEEKSNPTAIILSRNYVEISDLTNSLNVKFGAYIVKETSKDASINIITSGEELSLALEVSTKLKERDIDTKVISMPSIERFKKQDQKYKDKILNPNNKNVVIERSSSLSWYEFVENKDYLFTIDNFGYSASKEDIDNKFKFTVNDIEEKIEKLVN